MTNALPLGPLAFFLLLSCFSPSRIILNFIRFIFFLLDTAFFRLKVVKFVCDSLLTHFNSDNVHDFCYVSNIIRSFLIINFVALLYFTADIFLNRHQKLNVILGDKSEGCATTASSGSATHSVHVVFGCARHIIVEYESDLGNVQSTGGHIGRNQDVDVLRFELNQVYHTLTHRQLRMEHSHIEAEFGQEHGQEVTIPARRGKDDNLLVLLDFHLFQHVVEIRLLDDFRDKGELLREALYGLRKRFICTLGISYLDQFVGELAEDLLFRVVFLIAIASNCRGKEQRLSGVCLRF